MPELNVMRRDLLARCRHIGKALSRRTAEELIAPEQATRFRGKNIMTPDIWGYRLLAGGAILAEIAHGRGIGDDDLFGVTVYCVGDLAHRAKDLDNELSQACHSRNDVLAKLRALDAREGITSGQA